MADNNFKVFDEKKTNVMSDTDYANHTQRSNGVQSGVASSALHNKLSAPSGERKKPLTGADNFVRYFKV